MYKKNQIAKTVFYGFNVVVTLVVAYLITKPTVKPIDNISDKSSQDIMGIEGETYFVSKVFDGQTLKLSNGITINLSGIDVGKFDENDLKPDCYSKESYLKLKELLEGKFISYESDELLNNGKENIFAYVWVDEIFINDLLIREGFAKLSSESVNPKYKDLLIKSQDEARKNSKGLWSSCF